MDLCRLCSLSKLCHLHQCSLSVRPLLEKTNVRKNMQLNRMCHDLYLLSGDVLPRIPIKIECCTRFEYSYCCGLFIESIQYSIKAFSEWNEQAKKTHKHWTVFLFHFHELNILFTFRYFIAHMLDTTFVTFIVGVFFFFFSCFILFMISWAFQRLTMTKHEWTNQSDYQWFLCCTISVLNSAMEFGFLQRDLIRDTIVAVFEVDD